MIQPKLARLVVLWVACLCTISATGDELESVVGRPEPEDFILLDLDGASHRLSDYKGSVVLVSFWATWCPQCIWEMPSLSALSNTLPKKRFVILAVNVGERKKVVQAFVEQHAIIFPVLMDPDLGTYKKWPVLGIPASFLIDRQGKIAYSVVGATEWTEPETIGKIENLLEQVRSPETRGNFARAAVPLRDQ